MRLHRLSPSLDASASGRQKCNSPGCATSIYSCKAAEAIIRHHRVHLLPPPGPWRGVGQWVERGGMAQGCVDDQAPPSGARGQAPSIICRPPPTPRPWSQAPLSVQQARRSRLAESMFFARGAELCRPRADQHFPKVTLTFGANLLCMILSDSSNFDHGDRCRITRQVDPAP